MAGHMAISNTLGELKGANIAELSSSFTTGTMALCSLTTWGKVIYSMFRFQV